MSFRNIGAIRALEEQLGAPLCVVSSGIGSLIAAYYAFFGIDRTESFFRSTCEELRSILNINRIGAPGKNTSRTSQVIEEFLTLVKTQSSKKKLELYDSKPIREFIQEHFRFLKTRKAHVPVYASLYNIIDAHEHFFPIQETRILKAAVALVPFYEPIKIPEGFFISTESVQGLPSRFELFSNVDFHICVDTFPEDEEISYGSAFQILLASDMFRTYELKRRLAKQYDWFIDLRTSPKDKHVEFSALLEEGYQGVCQFLKS